MSPDQAQMDRFLLESGHLLAPHIHVQFVPLPQGAAAEEVQPEAAAKPEQPVPEQDGGGGDMQEDEPDVICLN